MRLKIMPILIIISLLIVGIGFVFLGSMDHQACPVFGVLGVDCPPIDNTLAIAGHHISGLQYFTQAVFNLSMVSLLFFVLFLSFIYLIYLKLIQHLQIQRHPLGWAYHLIRKLDIDSNKRLLYYLSLYNKPSPNI